MYTGVFNFKLPENMSFYKNYPTFPKPNTKEWLNSNGHVELKGSCLELIEFLSKNKEISKVYRLAINTRYECIYSSQDTFPSCRVIEILTAADQGGTEEEISKIAKQPYLFQR